MDSFASFAILLLIIGLLLLFAEVFLPSGGMLFLGAGLCITGSVWSAWNAWDDSPTAWWLYVASVVIAIPSAVGGALYIFPRTGLGKRVLLEPPDLEEVSLRTDAHDRLASLIGEVGRTATLLNPGGLVIVNGERIHCESEGMLIDTGVTVEILRLHGNDLVVRQIKAAAVEVEEEVEEELQKEEETEKVQKADAPPEKAPPKKNIPPEEPEKEEEQIADVSQSDHNNEKHQKTEFSKTEELPLDFDIPSDDFTL